MEYLKMFKASMGFKKQNFLYAFKALKEEMFCSVYSLCLYKTLIYIITWIRKAFPMYTLKLRRYLMVTALTGGHNYGMQTWIFKKKLYKETINTFFPA